MTTLAEFFEREAGASLHQLWSLVVGPVPDAPALHRTARILRGSAQMAREERVYRAALALETALRPVTAGENGRWGDPLFSCVRAAVDDLAVLVEGSDPSPELDGRLRASLERWQAAGVELPAPVFGRRSGVDPAGGMREFRAYAAREVEGIAQALDDAIRALHADPMDREALKAILRRQRALHGAARLDEIPVVAEVLRAVEDLTRVVAKLNVGVKQEWLDVYRTAREGLTAAIPSLSDDRDPEPSTALARLRHLRAELLARYGAGEAVNPSASQREGMAQVQRLVPELGQGSAPKAVPAAERVPKRKSAGEARKESPQGPTESPAVPITLLEYRGDAALRRALDLRPGLEGVVLDDPGAREQLEELFDLIRLALG